MMSDGMLSQEEIDALLNGTSSLETNEQNLNTEDYLTHVEQDALGEIGNISFGSSATALSSLLNQKVEITTPHVSIILKSRLVEEFPKPYVAVAVNYTTGFTGSNLFVINQEDASIIADLMLGGTGQNPSPEFGELQLSAVQEAMNQMMGSSATSMSTIFQKRVEISPPIIDILNLPAGEGIENVPDDDPLVKISFQLTVGNLINSKIMQLLPLSFAKHLVDALMNPTDELVVPQQQEEYKHEEEHHHSENLAKVAGNYQEQPSIPYNEQPVPYNHSTATIAQPKPVQPAVFTDFAPHELQEKEESRNLNILLDIPLQVTVELGKTEKLVRDVLELVPGSIIELDKLAGEPVDILVNNRLIAKGEVVVIEENFGVRVTDIVSPSERIKKMR